MQIHAKVLLDDLYTKGYIVYMPDFPPHDLNSLHVKLPCDYLDVQSNIATQASVTEF